MRINSINTVHSNNYQILSCRKNEVNFRGDLSGLVDEYNAYFWNQANNGYEEEKYERATDAISHQYSPLAKFHWSFSGISIQDQIAEAPDNVYNYNWKVSYYSLDDILEKREAIELNLINAAQKRLTYINKAKNLGVKEKFNVLSSFNRALEDAKEFFDSNPQLYTDKIKKQFEETVKNYETVLKDLKGKVYPGSKHGQNIRLS